MAHRIEAPPARTARARGAAGGGGAQGNLFSLSDYFRRLEERVRSSWVLPAAMVRNAANSWWSCGSWIEKDGRVSEERIERGSGNLYFDGCSAPSGRRAPPSPRNNCGAGRIIKGIPIPRGCGVKRSIGRGRSLCSCSRPRPSPSSTSTSTPRRKRMPIAVADVVVGPPGDPSLSRGIPKILSPTTSPSPTCSTSFRRPRTEAHSPASRCRSRGGRDDRRRGGGHRQRLRVGRPALDRDASLRRHAGDAPGREARHELRNYSTIPLLQPDRCSFHRVGAPDVSRSPPAREVQGEGALHRGDGSCAR